MVEQDDTQQRPPVIVVAGFMRCGMATTMAILEAGGLPIAGNATPPTYELPQTAHRLEDFVLGCFGAYGLSAQIMDRMPASVRDVGASFDASWLSGQRGQAVKLVNPHLLRLPAGAYRAIWLDRDEQDRARSVLQYIGATGTGLLQDIIADYFTRMRSPARAELQRAGATILDVRHEDLMADPDRRRTVVDQIADFVGLPLDRAAMVERTASVVW